MNYYYNYLFDLCKFFFLNYYFYFIILFLFIYLFFCLYIYFFIYIFNYQKNSYSYLLSFCFYLKFSLYFTIFIFFCNVLLFLFFDYSVKPFQIYFFFRFWSFFLDFGIDSVSLLFLLLTSFIIPLCILIHYYWPLFIFLERFYLSKKNYKIIEDITLNNLFLIFLSKSQVYLILILFLNLVLIFFFSTLNLFVFYITLELSMIPLFLIIGWFGSRSNKIKASYYIFFYTIIGSIFFFLGMLILFFLTGSLNLYNLYLFNFDYELQKFFFILFFIPFAVKVPIIPLHVWLPEAHVEAPTEGSVLLAGLLLKLGVYGIIRFLIPLFPSGLFYFSSFLYTLSLINIMYSSFIIFCQIDMKKIIAYSSIAHMNFAMLGLFSFISEGFQGSIYMFYTHGIISSGLFICVGFLYSRFYSRLLLYYSGLTYYMPFFSFIMFIFILGNLSFPGLGSFVSELLIFLGVFCDNFWVGFLSLFGSLFCTFYSILFFTKVCFGIPNFFKFYSRFIYIDDLNFKGHFYLRFKDFFLIEYIILILLLLLSLFTGFFPHVYINLIKLFSFIVNFDILC